MGHPELNSDESVILDTQNVVVKSVPFEAILTSERLILLNSRDTLLPPRYIPLAAIRGVETGENAIRDPVITLSVLTESGGPRPMVLTFSKSGGGERRRESDEWVRLLKERVAAIRQNAAPSVAPSSEVEPVARPEPSAPGQISTGTGRPAKKKIEIARPMKKISENAPAMPKPVETTSLPQGSFCGRCGNRVPPGSTFCNKCGTKVASAADPAEIPEPSVDQVPVPIPPVIIPSAEHRDRPIEQVIHSIEPLIEDSKPRTQPAPLVPSRFPHQPATAAPVETQPEAPAAPAQAPTAEPEQDQMQKSLSMFSNILQKSGTSEAGQAAGTGQGSASPAPAPSNSTVPQVAIPPVSTESPVPPAAQPPVLPARKKSRLVPFAIIIIVIIAIAGVAFVFLGHGGNPVNPIAQQTTVPTTIATTVATPRPTTIATTVPTPAVPTTEPTPLPPVIPQSGVWVHVKYDGTFTGSYGTPGAQQTVTDTGDHVYQISTSTGVVAASFTKNDGSAQPILLEVYKDGSLVQSDTSTTPKGTAQIQVDLKPPATATLAAETTAPAQTTAATNVTAVTNATA